VTETAKGRIIVAAVPAAEQEREAVYPEEIRKEMPAIILFHR